MVRRVSPEPTELEQIELQLFLDGVFGRYGWDFRDYAPASMRRRVRQCLADEKVETVCALLDRVLHDPACTNRCLATLSVNVSGMFRDPEFFAAFRKHVVPALKNLRMVRIWHVGCSTGEEVYSMAILLREEGLHERSRLYATDMNEAALAKAAKGVYPLDAMQEYTGDYQKAGGQRAFSEYYTASYGNAVFQEGLRKNIVWAQHNLATDGSFNEFHVILCRNVMIYFNRALQNRVHELFHQSLARPGFLGIGARESIRLTPHEDSYEEIDGSRIFRRVR